MKKAQKGMNNNRKNERRVELSETHAVLKEKTQEENDKCKKWLELECRGKTSGHEESCILSRKEN